MSYLQAVDCSHFQGEPNWREVASAGIDVAICKATQGVSFIDQSFAYNWQRIKAAGMVRGCYHFLEPTLDGQSQASHFLEVARPGPGDLCALDVEQFAGSAATMGIRVSSWLRVVEAATGRPPVVYCSPGTWDGNVAGDFSRYPLWVAHYTTARAPHLPRGWTAWAFWQYSSNGSVPGIQGRVDLDRFNGTKADLLRLCGGIEVTRIKNVIINNNDQSARVKAWLDDGNSVVDATDFWDYATWPRPRYDPTTDTLYLSTEKKVS
jgi:lysozyme